MKKLTKTEFMCKYGHRLVKLHNDDVETGDFQLFHPEEKLRAQKYLEQGYEVASVFETENEEDSVVLNNDTGEQFNKIGYLILKLPTNETVLDRGNVIEITEESDGKYEYIVEYEEIHYSLLVDDQRNAFEPQAKAKTIFQIQ